MTQSIQLVHAHFFMILAIRSETKSYYIWQKQLRKTRSRKRSVQNHGSQKCVIIVQTFCSTLSFIFTWCKRLLATYYYCAKTLDSGPNLPGDKKGQPPPQQLNIPT